MPTSLSSTLHSQVDWQPTSSTTVPYVSASLGISTNVDGSEANGNLRFQRCQGVACAGSLQFVFA
eukprot:m.19029 g.19029  ORF g.19029 m.19029 type:complete len:65 (+) comp10884_c0_seq1:273-467(+)